MGTDFEGSTLAGEQGRAKSGFPGGSAECAGSMGWGLVSAGIDQGSDATGWRREGCDLGGGPRFSALASASKWRQGS